MNEKVGKQKTEESSKRRPSSSSASLGEESTSASFFFSQKPIRKTKLVIPRHSSSTFHPNRLRTSPRTFHRHLHLSF
ncbi:hypothetical protein HPP92_026491 [Vanilla planifolia]|uniref:Uncharacterized protein n=1 Tax=Vanilla planifolia TaxID=51239 RepID=A0A835U7M3_VANPL|nr:hypothetical protein HPP92_026714 [Vanilla planifolia]KAG0451020.1 hypothetical protein HPP92_026491 [Vanilla planifolia]